MSALLPEADGSTAALLDRYAHADAIGRLVKAEQDRIRDVLDVQADAIEQATGGAFNVPVQGIGRELRTDPAPRPKVTNEHDFKTWFAETFPDECRDGWAVEVDNEAGPAVLALEDALDADDTDEIVAWAFEVCRAATARRRLLLPDDPAGWLVEQGHAVLGTDGLYSTDDGQKIPGTGVAQTARRLQVRIDKDRKQELDGQLAARWLPELGDGQ